MKNKKKKEVLLSSRFLIGLNFLFKIMNYNDIIEHVTVEELCMAYRSCLVHKRGKASSLEYELEYEMNNEILRRELNEGTYEIGPSICFCVTMPKVREVFAASFRDRIVHHLLMNKLLHFFEEEFIDSSYSCRVGKGVMYGVSDMDRQIKSIGKDCWYIKLDLEGFFMSIDKDKLWTMVENLLRSKWDVKRDGNDMEWWLALFEKVVKNRPEKNCVINGNPTLFDDLPPHKTLFKSNGKGLPIGNLTSQILANFYLSGIDKMLSSKLQGYGRYVDDLVMLGSNIKQMKKMLPMLRKELAKINLSLNEKKTIIQRADKGLLFTGYIIKPFGIFAGKRLIKAAIRTSMIKGEDPAKHLNRINSYYGFMRHYLTYGYRCKIWEETIKRYNIYDTNKNKTKLIRIDNCMTDETRRYFDRIKGQGEVDIETLLDECGKYIFDFFSDVMLNYELDDSPKRKIIMIP